MAFSGRFEPRTYVDRGGRQQVVCELHDVTLEYGAKPHGLAAIANANAERGHASA